MDILSIITETTCGFACWEAHEDICKCSCGGKNHGILRHGGERPQRMAKIDGVRYTLQGVGRGLCEDAGNINRSVGPKQVCRIDDKLTYTYYWESTDKGAPARVKPASRSQIDKWPELSEWRGKTESELYFDKPYLLWVREDIIAQPTA